MFIALYIYLLLGSHSAPVPYPTVRRFVPEMCACAHLCCGMVFSGLSLWCTVGFVSWVCCRELINLCVSVTAVKSWARLAHGRFSVFLVLTYLHCTYFAPMFLVCHTTLNKLYLILSYLLRIKHSSKRGPWAATLWHHLIRLLPSWHDVSYFGNYIYTSKCHFERKSICLII